jgi:alkylresorcinol/alkylpyrone synthase
MQILSAASAFPKYYYPQDVLCRALEEYWGEKLGNLALMRRLQRHTGVEGRYLSLPLQAYTKLATWGETNNLWIQTAVELGKQAVCRALNQAGLAPRDLGAFFFTSVTGVSSPSIDALLINRMGLSANIRRIPMFGLGCVAGAAGISRAADYVKAHPSQLAVLLSVELCSLTLQREDLSVAT